MKEPKEGKGTWDSPSFDPITVAVDGNRGNGIKRAINTNLTKRELGPIALRLTCHYSGSVALRSTCHGKDMSRRCWNKKINPHLTRSTGIDRGGRRKNGLRILSTNTPRQWMEAEGTGTQIPRFLDPHQLIRHHDLV
jgi:hypothetical protein